jgi:hypothetical protein
MRGLDSSPRAPRSKRLLGVPEVDDAILLVVLGVLHKQLIERAHQASDGTRAQVAPIPRRT